MATPKSNTKAVSKAISKPNKSTKPAPKTSKVIKGEIKETSVKKTRGSLGKFDGSAKIKLLVTENPKRGNCAKRFDAYFKGIKTVEQALDKGLTMADLRWDVEHEFIAVDGKAK